MIGWLRLMNWTHRKSTLKLKLVLWSEHFVPLPLFAKSLCFSRSHLEGLENYTGHRSYPNPPTIMIFPLKTQYAQTSINQSNITLKHKNILPDGLFYVHILVRLAFWMIVAISGSKVPLGSPVEPILIADCGISWKYLAMQPLLGRFRRVLPSLYQTACCMHSHLI